MSENGSRALVVRSSSTVEDGGSTSMAGMFTSELDVRGWDGFVDALGRVLASADSVPGAERAPMAVLVQPMLRPRFGGVLFGTDPVTGHADRRVIAAVEGGPDLLVSGQVDGAQYVVSRRGRVVSRERPLAGLTRGLRRALLGLARRVADVFGGAQDVEWAVETDGTLRLLQSRPVTAVGSSAAATGPVLGPGPVAETFPEPLAALEEDLWVAPLREGLVEALRLTGTSSRRAIERSPVVATVGGRVAADLALLGIAPRRRSWIAKLDPRPPARRLAAAWRVGRLRAALPGLAEDVVDDVDARLLEVPELSALGEHRLVALLDRARGVLRSLHGYEVLAGLLAGTDAGNVTGASVALWALGEGRARGLSDVEIAAHDPVVLALVAPRVGAEPVLPPLPTGHRPAPAATVDRMGTLREALRLRARWTQELGARAAWELGQRLARDGRVPEAAAVRHLTLAELGRLVAGGEVAASAWTARAERPPAAPLPAAFRLTPEGEPVAVALPRDGDGGRGAGGGRGIGRAHVGGANPPTGSVLVVRTLEPGLASLLPQLGGLVAETGSVLSHLAILARELGVPTVVGVAGATARFEDGQTVLVDGTSGEVRPWNDGGAS